MGDIFEPCANLKKRENSSSIKDLILWPSLKLECNKCKGYSNIVCTLDEYTRNQIFSFKCTACNNKEMFYITSMNHLITKEELLSAIKDLSWSY